MFSFLKNLFKRKSDVVVNNYATINKTDLSPPIVITYKNKHWILSDLKYLITVYGQRGAADYTGIPRTSMMRKMNAAEANSCAA